MIIIGKIGTSTQGEHISETEKLSGIHRHQFRLSARYISNECICASIGYKGANATTQQ
jgi:hypothetical protein